MPSIDTLYVAVSCRAHQFAWSWRHVRTDGSFEDRSQRDVHTEPMRLRTAALLSGLTALPDGIPVEVVTTDAELETLVQVALPAWREAGYPKQWKIGSEHHRALVERAEALTVRFRHQPRRTGDFHAKDCKKHARAAAESGPAVVPAFGDAEVVVWTDGGARQNPGPAGWGMLLVHRKSGTTLLRRGGESPATNNRMELTAIAEALSAFSRPSKILVFTDSKFAISVCTEWRQGWKRRGWRRANGDPPVNLDVIQRLDALLDRHEVRFQWVKGHSGDPGNELVDQLCNDAIDALIAGGDPSHSERRKTPPFPVIG